jgi:hypothetical protein
MHIFKPITLTWWQIGVLKLAVLSFAFLIAHYWPVVTEWTTVWWILFAVCALYTAKLRLAPR